MYRLRRGTKMCYRNRADMRYVLLPGYITSKSDGQVHYINPLQLARLYGVNIKECRIVYRDSVISMRSYNKTDDDIELYPRYDGDYRLPTLPPRGGMI